ncbi:DUF72 domain-containing protein [Pseudomonas stutzeri]|uniref:DUF72 domain-containing protein n=1 Tax=Stutzerimonas stutzeri TaxID=316 RepID=A0A2N8S330_STUST|nr:DUF72 domain-containing protein [Stutzerimonas stutzeri]MCQ4296605.1 DUF72 domain-containing protein [Stutzerimonas stutzeri]PNF81033.1 DUF72 domain-containing protein [Stutzerimonas stutzeri]
MKPNQTVRLGCAGWSLPRPSWSAFPNEGTHLQRYAQRLPAVEINSSFYRPHRPGTYHKWAASVPEGFSFCVKLPRQISHEQRLRGCDGALGVFLDQVTELGARLGCLLLQLPPSLGFDSSEAADFFGAIRERYGGQIALEPRHASWLDAEELLDHWHIARVAADPSPITGGDRPSGWSGMRYYRLHGSPRIYHSAYSSEWLAPLADELRRCAQSGVPCWCIFDNTASGAAVANALAVQAMLRG